MADVKDENVNLSFEAENNSFYCFGCGVKLQTNDPSKRGYIPEKLLKDTSKPLLCQRCFRIQHYSDDENNEDFNEVGLLNVLDRAKQEKALIVYIIDLFSFESTFIKSVNRKLSNVDVILVANKRDILPKAVDDKKLKNFVNRRATELGFNVIDVVVTSASKNYNIDELMTKIMKYRHNGNVYMVGSASCGKSSLINVLLKNYSNETSNFITTSPIPGTTLDVVEVPLDETSFIYDTPGLTIRNSMLSLVDKKVINAITPKVEVKPKTFQLDAEQSLLIGGLAYFDFVKGKKSNFTVYTSNQVDVSRSKMEKAPTVFNNMLKQNQLKPTTSKIKSTEDLEAHSFTLNKKGKVDIGVNGLGWICVEATGQEVVLHAPKGINVYYIDAKI